jgi:hypothetical protein
VLATLKVKGRSPLTGYSRDQFGRAWLDADRNGCDTRNDILTRDLTQIHYRSGTGGCVVQTGTLHDPYTGARIAFIRGNGDLVDIDHVVALADAWVTGASGLPFRTRVALANDPYNLLAVDAGANRSKGDGDTATWLPPVRSYRCAYVARQIGVKAKYHVWVTRAEHDAMVAVLGSCPGQRVPRDLTHAPTTVNQNITGPSEPNAPASKSGSGAGGVYYQNCAAVRAAGAAPLYAGQPGYSRKLDRDGDGIACE